MRFFSLPHLDGPFLMPHNTTKPNSGTPCHFIFAPEPFRCSNEGRVSFYLDHFVMPTAISHQKGCYR